MFNVGGEDVVKSDQAEIIRFVTDILDRKHLETENVKKISDVEGVQQYDVLTLYQKHNPEMTRIELIDATLNFIIAGRCVAYSSLLLCCPRIFHIFSDTTRLLLSWFVYELCSNENKDEILRNLMTEVNAFANGKEPSYNDFVSGFKYLECALCETLRLYPVVPFNFKGCFKDVSVPTDDGMVTIRKGDRVLIDHWSRNRDPKIFSDPLTFEPDRWKSKGINTFNQYEYGVFNIAPRVCLGKSFAMTEAKVFAFHFLRSFDFEAIGDGRPVIQRGALLNMANGFYINVTQK